MILLNILKKKKQEEFSDSATQNYDETLEVLFQNVDTLISSFASIGLYGRSLGINEIESHIYKALNPKRSQTEPRNNEENTEVLRYPFCRIATFVLAQRNSEPISFLNSQIPVMQAYRNIKALFFSVVMGMFLLICREAKDLRPFQPF